MNLDLRGKNALVGGSSKGIGAAVAHELAALGANITLSGRNIEPLMEVAHRLDRSKGQEHDYLLVDFENNEDLKKKVGQLVLHKPIHILVNNSGGPAPGKLKEARSEEFIIALQRHLLAYHSLVRLVLPGMQSGHYGRIINIISTSVKEALPNLGVSNTVRAAVANWAKTLANELGPHGITVNNVLPGTTKTERLEQIIAREAHHKQVSEEEVAEEMKRLIPLGRFAEAGEIAAAVAFLASPAAAYITGTNVVVDGGRCRSL